MFLMVTTDYDPIVSMFNVSNFLAWFICGYSTADQLQNKKHSLIWEAEFYSPIDSTEPNV